jgi:hypothetical protein
MLKEINAKTYSFSDPEVDVISPNKNFVSYTFENKKKTQYEVTFESTYYKDSDDFKWETEVSFDTISEETPDTVVAFEKPEIGETDEFDAIAVLYTVADIILAFIDKFKPESLSYTGIVSRKETPGASLMTKRDRIYDMMVQSMISKAPDYDFKRVGFNMNIFYKGELPVPGHDKIFDYPTE